ncbi:MAG TPA: SDR family NAD(P)-dependent oxidoreductase, partial [Myxococcota bacterium]|nr:SDR family NAD(P)-dependent oxidoreductase [Myxococcota bacterium]
MSARVAVVTGASRGIGRQLCIDLAKQGFDVVCAARSTAGQHGALPGTVDETAEQVRKAGRRALAVAIDVRDEESVASLAQRVFDELGRCDLLVNNAAVAPPKPALKDSTKRWRLSVDVNVNGPFYFIYYFAPRMTETGGGRVVNISSGAAHSPEFGRASYMTTKAALEAMTRSLAHDLRGKVAVNCIRLELPVWTEGFAATLPKGVEFDFEDPVIMSDAVLWLADQPIDYSG